MTTNDDPETLRARIAELEARCQSLELRLPSQGPRTSGRFVVVFIACLLALAFATALGLWTTAKRASAARAAVVASVPKPSASRVDAVGRAVSHGIDACIDEKPIVVPSAIVVRVKLTPMGTLGLLDTRATPANDDLGACLRKIPTRLNVAAAGSEGAGDVEVRYDVALEPDGARTTKISWAQRPTSPAFAY